MARAVLCFALLLVSRFGCADGIVATEEGQVDGSLISLEQSLEGENANSIDFDDCVLKTSAFSLQSFGTTTAINTSASISSGGCTRFQPIRAPPILLIQKFSLLYCYIEISYQESNPMIVSITCRNGTEENTRRSKVNRELLSLSNYDSGIARAQAVFSKQTHHKNSDDLVTCHLSICLPNKHQVDIYERQSTEMLAFHRAKERVIKKIKRDYSPKYVSLKRAPLALESEALM